MEPITGKQLKFISYHMRAEIKKLMPTHFEDIPLPNGLTQRSDLRSHDFVVWAEKNLSLDQAYSIIRAWYQGREQDAINLLIESGLPTKE